MTPTAPTLSLGSRLGEKLGSLVLGFICLGATNALGLAIPWLLKGAIDALGTLGAAAQPLVVRYATYIVAFALAQAVIRTASRVLIFNAGRHVEYRLRRDLFAHLLRMPPSFFQRHPTGDLMSRLTNDLSSVRMLFGPGILNGVNTLIVYGSGLWLMTTLNGSLTLAALLPFPFLIVVGRLFSRTLYRSSRDVQEHLGKMSSTLQEDLSGVTVVKQYVLEGRRRAHFATLNDQYLAKSLTLVRVRGALSPLFAALVGVGSLVVLWLGGRYVIEGRMTVGELVAFNAYLAYLAWPTMALGWILSLWQRGMAAWTRVRELLATAPTLADPADGEPLQDGTHAAPSSTGKGRGPSLRVSNLTVTRGENRVLDGVSFALAAGQTLAVVGRTGAGKSTLMEALARLLEVPAGTVFFDGKDVTELPLAQVRQTIGYAPQEAFLFSTTVAENIAFGGKGDGPTDGHDQAKGRVLWAAEAAGLAPDLAAFPAGLETLVGERGITLSGGQRQRIALARALFVGPGLLLLDDSLCSVDAETEQRILEQLKPIMAGRTSVVVSHRVAAVKEADQILVLEGGRVVERGHHRQLVAADGAYAALYREQLASPEGASP